MLMYLFAVFFVQVVEEELSSLQQQGGSESDWEIAEELKKHWGSIGRGVYTLYMSITGGMNWQEPAAPLLLLSPVFVLVFCLYIAVAIFCVLNTVTGILVEKANSIVGMDKDNFLWREMRKRKQWIEEVKRSFRRADTNDSGRLSREEFEAQMNNVSVQMDLKSLGIDTQVTEPDILFELFDFDGDGTIDINEFATGVQRLHGHASALDMGALKTTSRYLRDDIQELMRLAARRTGNVAARLD
jgi:hypothetical protein